MQVIYIFIILIGVTMLILGLIWLALGFDGKEIIRFPLAEKQQEFEITKTGRYGVFVVGTKSIRKTGDFSVHMQEIVSQTAVEVKECAIKFNVNTIKMKMVEFFQFEIPYPGKYRIEFENIHQIDTNTYLLKSSSRHRMVGDEKLQILIKKTLPVNKKIGSILLLCIGFNILVWGFILAVDSGMGG